jgi:hypothetical protein
MECLVVQIAGRCLSEIFTQWKGLKKIYLWMDNITPHWDG